MTTAGCGCQYDATGRPFVDRCVCAPGRSPGRVSIAAADMIMRAVGGCYALGVMDGPNDDVESVRVIAPWMRAEPTDRVTFHYVDGPPLNTAGIVVANEPDGRVHAFVWIPVRLLSGDEYTFVPRDLVVRFHDGLLW